MISNSGLRRRSDRTPERMVIQKCCIHEYYIQKCTIMPAAAKFLDSHCIMQDAGYLVR